MNNDNTTQFIQSAISHEIQLVESLTELLAQERVCLETYQYPQLLELLEKKNQILVELEQSHQRRLKSLGIPYHSPQAFKLFEQYIEQQDSLKKSWNTLKTLLSQCQEDNAVNGKVIQFSQQSTERILNIFRQSQGSGTYTGYSSKGTAIKEGGSLAGAKA